MNNKRLISLTICWILVVVPGLAVLAFADTESGTNTEAQQHFEKANELRKLADYDAAIIEYKKVISLSPNSKIAQDAQYWIGQSYFGAGQFDAALSAFQKLLDEYPASPIIPSTKLMIQRVKQAKKTKSLFEAVKKDDIEQVKKLISEGADVNVSMRDILWTLLLDAASTGQTQIVKLLLQHGAKVDAADDGGYTPLYYAIWSKDEEGVRTLISAGADINKRPNENDYPPLFYAVWQNFQRGIRILIDAGANVNAEDENGWTPLHHALQQTNADVAKQFIGTGVKIPDFHNAILEGNLAKVKQLVESGMDVDTRDKFGCTPAYWALSAGQKEVFKYLLSQGANVRVKTNKGRTLLQQASQGGFAEMVKLLIAKGADVNAAADDGTHPLGGAAVHGHKKVVRLLLANGAEVNLHSEGRGTLLHTALHAAAWSGHSTIVDLLITKGADVNLNAINGGTPLHRAARCKRSVEDKTCAEIVEKLLAKGADVNVKDPRYDRTPLHIAARRGRLKAAELLIAAGADVNATDKDGKTPLSLAQEAGRTEIAELLRKHGAKE